MQQNMIHRSNEMAASFLTYEIRNKLDIDKLSTPKTGSEYEELSQQIESLNLGPDVRRIKIWNRDFTIVWASSEDEVGEYSPGHHELIEVYGGNLISEISTGHYLNEKYAYAGSAAHEVMELYIPFRSEPEGDVTLVFEVYRNIDALLADIRHHNRIVWGSTTTGIFLLYLVLFGLVWGASRRIDKQGEEIKVSEERFRSLIHSAQDGIVSADRNGRIFLLNKAAERLFGYSAPEAHGLEFSALFPDDNDANSDFQRELSCYVTSGECLSEGQTFELHGLPKNGKEIPLEVSLSVSENGENQILTGMIRDISERKKAEEQHENLQAQLIQMQKMETVGRLAGGIAHDFNNILSAIIGYSELVLHELPPESQTYQDVETIKESGEKAAVMTGQLLAFSRKQVLKMQAVDLNATIEGMAKMLTRLMGEHIKLDLRLTPQLPTIRADASQLEQIILNLAVNGRDAMPEGGHLIIATSEVELERDYVDKHPEAKLGRHLSLAVSDTGSGITEEVRQQIFDPFFTTKERSKGTGLGLSTVYGIVKQHESQISVYSEIDKGTTFKIFFPAGNGAAVKQTDMSETVIPKGEETILLAEDDQTILRMIRNCLEPCGYNLLVADNGQEAIEISRAYGGEIQLLLTDVIMPKLDGQELANLIRNERPDIDVIFMSGYTDDVIAHHGVLDADVNFIQKPVTPSKLAQALKEVLDIS